MLREPNTKSDIRFIDSRFRNGNGGNTNSNFKIDIHRVEGAKKMKVRQANVVSSEYDINDRNNKLYFTVSATPYTATLTNGKYGPSALATEIQTAMDAQTSGNTVSFDTSTYKITISRASSFTLDITSTTNAIWEYIGFNGSSDLTATSHTGTGLVNTTSLYYYVTMDCVRNQKFSKNHPRDTCCFVHNTASAWGNLLTITEPFMVDISQDVIDSIEVKIYNNRGNLIDLEEITVNFELEFFY
jgi:hypothetical protein